MASDGSVTHWLQRLQVGDPAAVQPLWATPPANGLQRVGCVKGLPLGVGGCVAVLPLHHNLVS
jgi:hypothetical protein